MSSPQLPSRPKRLLFIDDSPTATRDDQRKNRKAKSHTARVIWENQRKRRDGFKATPLSGTARTTPIATEARLTTSATTTGTQPRPMLEIDQGYEESPGPLSGWQVDEPDLVLWPTPQMAARQIASDFPLSRTISPMFGGAPGGFRIGDTSVVAVTTDYCS